METEALTSLWMKKKRMNMNMTMNSWIDLTKTIPKMKIMKSQMELYSKVKTINKMEAFVSSSKMINLKILRNKNLQLVTFWMVICQIIMKMT